MTRKRREISPDDWALWGRVVETARPLHAEPRRFMPEPEPVRPAPLRPAQPDQPAAQVLKPSGATTGSGYDFAPPISEALAAQRVQMDKRQFQRLRRGKLEPDARIDLHGMTLAQAHGALNGFILRAQSAGARLVLVITGKGRNVADDGPIPRRPGALKHDVPQWLRMAPLGQAVLEVREAHARHGGSGAYYVYLRRAR